MPSFRAACALVTLASLSLASDTPRPDVERGATTASVTIPVCALNPLNHTTAYFRNAVLLRGDVVGGGNSFLTPVNIPDGSVITAVRLLVDDSSAAQNVNLRLWGASSFNSLNLGSISTTATPGAGTLQLNVNHSVDNALLAYSVEVAWTTPNPVDQIRIGAIRIQYTPPGSAAACQGDVNHDQLIDGRDLSVVLSGFGSSCAP